MIKSFTCLFFSLLLISSIVVPAVINLLTDSETYVYVNITEEEKSEKYGKEIKKNLKQISYSEINLSQFLITNSCFFYYIENNSNHYSKIVLPPPEHII